MNVLVNLLVGGLIVAVLWWVMQPHYVFVVQFDGQGARVTRGKVTPAFLERFAEVCREGGVAQGWVGGIPRGRRRISLAFSRGIPEGCRQQLRNLWLQHG
jgi:hypothetical protein